MAVVMIFTITTTSANAAVSRLSWNAAVSVKNYIGYPYVYGGDSPAGFDCSGLAQYVYGRQGIDIPRTAEEQYLFYRAESKSKAWGGDLVFFHDPDGYVYHTGVYEGGNAMVSALNPVMGIRWTPLSWGLDGPGTYYTFGTISH